jgi:hypothetical protein
MQDFLTGIIQRFSVNASSIPGFPVVEAGAFFVYYDTPSFGGHIRTERRSSLSVSWAVCRLFIVASSKFLNRSSSTGRVLGAIRMALQPTAHERARRRHSPTAVLRSPPLWPSRRRSRRRLPHRPAWAGTRGGRRMDHRRPAYRGRQPAGRGRHLLRSRFRRRQIILPIPSPPHLRLCRHIA